MNSHIWFSIDIPIIPLIINVKDPNFHEINP